MDRPAISSTRITALAAAATIAIALSLGASAPADAQEAAGAAVPGWRYVSPVPGAERVAPATNIILRPGGPVDPASVPEGGTEITVTGSVSGDHPGRARISDDGRTITFRPFTGFTPGETVTCDIAPGIRTDAGLDVPPGSFQFTVAGSDRPAPDAIAPSAGSDDPLEPWPTAAGAAGAAPAPSLAGALAGTASDSLPADFPRLTASVIGRPSPGRYFLANFDFLSQVAPSYAMIVGDDGRPWRYRRFDGETFDFKPLPDGRLTYFDRSRGQFYAMDSTFADVDSFACGNGYVTDVHDIVVMPDDHALLMAYDPEIVDMSAIDPKGQPTAVVVGLIIQEIDREKNVVFEWRSWDHFQITDMQILPLNSRFIDYVHGNSLCLDLDGNIVLSSRHMNEITKIDRTTGDVVWRLGGKNNQFTFVDDPIGFSYQHDARILPNGHLTVFDNGNLHAPPFSRAVEYELDTKKMTATLVWQYRHDPDVFGAATGSVQRLPTGNTLIGWGITTPTLTAVTPDGTVLSELTFDPGTSSYRAYRYDWPAPLDASVAIVPTTINLDSNAPWITASIEPVGWNLDDLLPGSILLGDAVPADSTSISYGDLNANGVRDLDVRFDRAAAAPLLTAATTWLDVSGALVTGARFRGIGFVRINGSNDGRAASVVPPALVSATGALPARLVLPGDPRLAGASALGGRRTLAVYDVRGRLVRRWRASVAPGGGVSWSGRGADGRRVASGIYFVRAEGRAPTAAAKVVIAR